MPDPVERPEGEIPKVYAFCNSGNGTDWQVWMAMAEDGHVLGQHVCSSRIFGPHDVGPAFKGDAYLEHFGGIDEGVHFAMVVVETGKAPPPEVVARNRALANAAEVAL